MKHECVIALDRYPTCSCGSGTWPCDGGAYQRRVREAFAKLDKRGHRQEVGNA